MNWLMAWITIAGLALSARAQASLLLEPYGGYGVGSVNRTISPTNPFPGLQNDTGSGSINGGVFGGRAGFVLHHFLIVAAEYQGMSAKELISPSTTSTAWNQHTWFGTLGFQAPMGFRLMGSYGWDFEADEATTPNTTSYKGTAMKLLVGWHLPMLPIAINFEYTIYKANTYLQNGASGNLSDVYTKNDYSSAMVTLSLPMTFLHMHGGGSEGGGSHSSSP